MNREQALGAVRHVLTGLGGAFLSLGIVGTEDEWSTIVGGVITVGGIVWSWVSPEKQSA